MSKELSSETTLWYACKANPMSAILKIFRNLGFGIDVASTGELDQALRSGIKPKNIISTAQQKVENILKYFWKIMLKPLSVKALTNSKI